MFGAKHERTTKRSWARLFGARKRNRRLAKSRRAREESERGPLDPEIQARRAERDEQREQARALSAQRREQRQKVRRARRVDALRNVARQVSRGVLTAGKLVLLATLLVAAAATGYFGYRQAMRSTHFDVATIEVAGARHALPAELVSEVTWAKGQSIFAIDTARIAATVAKHPWVEKAEVLRVLPSTLRIEVVEHTACATALLGHFYLVSDKGELFKRATSAEADGLPVLSGPDRQDFTTHPALAHFRIACALDALQRYRARIRPAVSEVHVGPLGEVTFFLHKSGTALRFGALLSDERLQKFDAVWVALGPDSQRARAIYLDHETRVDRVVVRLAPRASETARVFAAAGELN